MRIWLVLFCALSACTSPTRYLMPRCDPSVTVDGKQLSLYDMDLRPHSCWCRYAENVSLDVGSGDTFEKECKP